MISPTSASLRRRCRAATGFVLALAVGATAWGGPTPPRRAEPWQPAGAGGEEARWASLSLERLGLTETVRRYYTRGTLTLPFSVRADHVPVAARLRLTLRGPEQGRPPLGPVEVLVNGELVETLAPAAPGSNNELFIPLNAALIGDQNVLVLRRAKSRPCERVRAGAWAELAGGRLEMQSRPLPLPDDLATLPLPFVDPRLDENPAVPVVLLTPRTSESAQAAGLVAAYFGLQVGSPLRFDVLFDEVPDRSAVVLVTDPNGLETLGLDAPSGPTLRVLNHPRGHDGTRKLLVVAGRDQHELVVAAEALATSSVRLSGPSLLVAEPPAGAASLPYDAPRWVRDGAAVRIAGLAGGGLAREGLTGGSMEVSFRVAPDLFAWPRPSIDLELHYSASVPPALPPPTLLVELNGHFVGRLELPHGRAASGEPHVAHLPVHRSRLRGFNRLVVHAEFPEAGDACALAPGTLVRVVIGPASVLHVEGLPHFAVLPDVGLFVHDGFPFSRVADLGETAVVLSDSPAPQELALLLSALSQLAAVSGVAPRRAVYLTAGELVRAAPLDRDLLIVSRADRNELVRRWARLLPFQLSAAGVHPRWPRSAASLLRFFAGRGGIAELGRARRFAAGQQRLVVAGIESPLAPGRSAVFLIAPAGGAPSPGARAGLPGLSARAGEGRGSSVDSLPPSLIEAMGYAEAAHARGDLLLAADDRRGIFWLGPTYTRGQVPLWTRVRWFLSLHWMLLLPLLLLPGVLLALLARRSLDARAQRRLSPPGGHSP